MLLEPPLDRRRNRRRDPRVLLAWAALALALVVPPQLLGGIDGWAIGSTVLLALLALGAAQYATRGAWAVPYRNPLLLAMLVLLGWTALQAMPIPCALAELLVPEAAAQVIRNRELLTDSSAGACTLSWDPGATRWEIGKGLAIVAVFTGGWLLTIAGHRRKVLIAAGASALLMAVVGLAHAAVDAERVFGLYAPRYDMPRPVLAPLLNPNQLAGFLAMGVPVLAALGLGTRDLAVRSLWLAGSAICGATTVVTLSRGGLAGLVAGLVLLGLLVTIKQRGRRTMARFGWIGGLLTVILALAAYLALEPVTRELTEGDVSKLELIGKAGLFALEHPWIGVGRGAFATAFVQGGHLAEHRAEYAESFPVQWAAEWGLPVTLGLVGVLAMGLRRALGKVRSTERAGALAAVASIAVHELVDFSLELVGVAVVGSAVLAAAVGPRRQSRTSNVEAPEPLRLRQTAAPLIIAGAVLLLVLAPSLVQGSVRSLQDELTGAMQAGERERFRERLEHGLALHPSEPIFPLLAAAEGVRNADPSAVEWINRSMELAPGWAGPHVLAARWLWARGAENQAMLEAREAASRSPTAPRSFLCAKLRRHPNATHLWTRATPEGPMRVPFLQVAIRCMPPGSDAAAKLDAMLLEANPGALRPRLRQARRLADAGKADQAVRRLATLAERQPGKSEVWLALARAQVAAGEPRKAVASVERAEQLRGDRVAVLRVRARAQAALEDFEGMRDTLEQLRGLSGASAGRVAKALTFEGDLWQQAGRPAKAVAAYARANRVDPRRDRLERVAQVAEDMGDRMQAFRIYLELCQRFSDVPRFCEARDRLRRTMRESIPLEDAAGPNSE